MNLYLIIELLEYAAKASGIEGIVFVFLQFWLLSQMLFEFKMPIFL
jgi:hypothetical protein